MALCDICQTVLTVAAVRMFCATFNGTGRKKGVFRAFLHEIVLESGVVVALVQEFSLEGCFNLSIVACDHMPDHSR